MARHISGSLLPSCAPRLLRPVAHAGADGVARTFEVRAVVDRDTHELHVTTGTESMFLASHGNAYSLHLLLEHLVAGERSKARKQVAYLLDCGGMALAVESVLQAAGIGEEPRNDVILMIDLQRNGAAWSWTLKRHFYSSGRDSVEEDSTETYTSAGTAAEAAEAAWTAKCKRMGWDTVCHPTKW